MTTVMLQIFCWVQQWKNLSLDKCVSKTHTRQTWENIIITMFNISSFSRATSPSMYPTQIYWNLMAASNAGGVWKNRDSRGISGFGIDNCWIVTCYQHVDAHHRPTYSTRASTTKAAMARISGSCVWQMLLKNNERCHILSLITDSSGGCRPVPYTFR